MLRSEDMSICDVYLQSEGAFEGLTQLGELEVVQFIDMNPGVSPLDRHFVTDLCRCAELERILMSIKESILKNNNEIPRLRFLYDIKPLQPRDLFEFENMIDSVAKDVKDINANHSNLIKLRSETKEIYYVLDHLDPILGNVESGYTKLPKVLRPMNMGEYDRRQLKIITGVVDRSTNNQFQTMLWRVSHGSIYYKEAPNDETFQNVITGQDIRKVAFVVVCHGEEMQQRLLKVCNGFNVNLYRWPETHDDRISTINELGKRMVEMDKVLQRTKHQKTATFRTIALQWENWMTQVRKAKAIYYNLNLFNFDISNNTLLGQCWLADRNFTKAETALERSSQVVGSRSFLVKTYTELAPPTSYRTTKFTVGFQNLINAYDYGRYHELNPGIFSIILFPFLFGVMLGDVGHGTLLLTYGAWMINNENKYMNRRSLNDAWNVIFEGRYMILLMGAFSIFMGFLYNEWFSLNMKLMSPFWLNPESLESINSKGYLKLNPKNEYGPNYKYGFDPGMKLSYNGLAWECSVKMKLAVIIGFAHMTFGILLSICNMIYFKKYYAIFCNALPCLICIWCIYGYLVYRIFVKWMFSVQSKNTDFRDYWPTLKHEFLDFLFWRNISLSSMGFLEREGELNLDLFYIHKLIVSHFRSLETTKVYLYHIAIACFPVMLLGSPLYLLFRQRMIVRRLEQSGTYGECQIEAYIKQKGLNMQALLLRRCLRTMEFALAVISHMASYLRLWAISVAHTLLSDILYDVTLRKMALSDFTYHGIMKIILAFALWAVITAFFLVFMDSLTVFIHVLRLHWIEFMSRFFKGGGIPFIPFSLVTVLDELDFKREEDETEAICRIRRARASAGDS